MLKLNCMLMVSAEMVKGFVKVISPTSRSAFVHSTLLPRPVETVSLSEAPGFTRVVLVIWALIVPTSTGALRYSGSHVFPASPGLSSPKFFNDSEKLTDGPEVFRS